MAEGRLSAGSDSDSAIDVALEIVHELTALANQSESFGAARQVFELLNARLFLNFHEVQVKRRKLNKVTGGVVTFGDAPPPIELYEGPTGRRKIKGPKASVAIGPGEQSLSSPPGKFRKGGQVVRKCKSG